MLTIVIFILILGLLVFIHELGHFIAAKKNGVRVDEFGLGFPPRIFGVKRGETVYSLNLIPLGGFVKVFGEEYHETKEKNLSSDLKHLTFIHKKPWQKLIILFAGVAMNFLLGWVVISYLFTIGLPVPTEKVVLEKVIKNSPAESAGLKDGDILISIRTSRITTVEPAYLKSPNDLIALTKKYAGKEIIVDYERGAERSSVTIIPRKNPPKGQGSIGVYIGTSYEEKKYPWYLAPFYGLKEASNITRHIVTELLRTLGQLVTFQKPQVDVAGPVGIAKVVDQARKFGFKALLEVVALLSLNLAVVNILPFPALDGGRVVFVVYEWISKKRVNAKLEKNLNLAGMAILLSLAVLITINDIIKIYK